MVLMWKNEKNIYSCTLLFIYLFIFIIIIIYFIYLQAFFKKNTDKSVILQICYFFYLENI